MSEKERKEFQEIMETYRKKVTRSKETSQKFLVELGIITEKGNLRKPYKHLCIPQDQE